MPFHLLVSHHLLLALSHFDAGNAPFLTTSQVFNLCGNNIFSYFKAQEEMV